MSSPGVEAGEKCSLGFNIVSREYSLPLFSLYCNLLDINKLKTTISINFNSYLISSHAVCGFHDGIHVVSTL